MKRQTAIPKGNWTDEGIDAIKSIYDYARNYINLFDEGSLGNDWQVLAEIKMLIDKKVKEGYLPREAHR